LSKLPADTSDKIIAEMLADYYLAYTAYWYRRGSCLFIFHDVRKRSKEGPCPLTYDWSHMNLVGISAQDITRARAWAVDAMLRGYAVFQSNTRKGWGFGQGSIADFRKRQERKEGRV
jgi:hypothetical protein